MTIHWTPLLQKHPFPVVIVHDGKNSERNARNNQFRVELWRNGDSRQSLLGILGQEVWECHAKWRGENRAERELMGHAVECCVASIFGGFNIDAYEALEASVLVGGYGELFDGMTQIQVQQQLRQRRTKAAAWVLDHHGFFEHWKGVLA